MILLASAKTMKPTSTTNCTQPVYNQKAQVIRDEIGKMSYEQLAAYFKIKGKTLDNTHKYYSQPLQGKVVTSLDGVVFKQIKALNDDYIGNNVYILDAMYGILNGNDKIDLFRLDFNTKSVVDTSYYNYWQEDVHNFIENTKHEQLLVLTSDEYTKLLNLQAIKKEIFQIEFTPEIKSSVHKKQVRGKIANYCINHQVEDYHLLNNIVIDEYKITMQTDNILLISRNEVKDV